MEWNGGMEWWNGMVEWNGLIGISALSVVRSDHTAVRLYLSWAVAPYIILLILMY